MGTIKELRAEAVRRAENHFDDVCYIKDALDELLRNTNVLSDEFVDALHDERERMSREWKLALMGKQLARKGFNEFYPDEPR